MSTLGYNHVVARVISRSLAGNPLADPAERDLHLLVPDEHDRGLPTPVVFVLAGYSGSPRSMLTDDPWSEGLRQRIERLADAGRVGPTIYVLPDCFTRYGGSQYINSAATGRYEDYLWQDILPWVRTRYHVSRVGVVGKSSGGYGALVQAMRHPDLVSAVACHSGDLGFEYCYLPDLPKLLRGVWRHGGVRGFLSHFDVAAKKRDDQLLDVMDMIAMASCYSPDPTSPDGLVFPCDLETGAFRPEVWARWSAWDPLRMIDAAPNLEALKRQKLVFFDCGTRDEYHLDVGARTLSAKLTAAGVRHVYQSFDDGHMNIPYRYDVSLPLLWEALR